MDYIHIIINFFANGKSEMKVYLFFVFLIMLLLIMFFNQKKSKKTSVGVNSNKHKKLLITLMIVLYSLNLGSFLYFYKSNDIPYLSNIYLYNNNEVSSTNILHNHTLKAPIGFFINKVGLNPVQEYVDTGYAFTPFFPEFFLYTILVLVLFFILILFLYASKQKQTFLQTLIFSIVSFSVIKNIFDGGVFHTEAILGITAFLILLQNNSAYKRKDQQVNLLIFLIYIFVGIYLAFTVSEHLSSSRYVFLERFIQKFFFFFALIIIYFKNQINTKLVVVACSPIILIISFQYLSLMQEKYENNITNITNSQKIIALAKNPVSNLFEIESSTDLGKTSVILGNVKTDTKNTNIIKELGMKGDFKIYHILDITCNFSRLRSQDFIVKLDNKNLIFNSNLIKLTKNNDKLSIETSSCLYITPSILKEIFTNHNINTIILIENGKYIN